MAIKTVSLKQEAYQRLRAARRYPGESFSEVVLRARWDDQTITGRELLERYGTGGATFTDSELDAIDAVSQADAPPRDKWSAP
jgi:predicted CopG family antitoxin